MASSHDATGPCDWSQGLVASSHDATSPCDLLQGLVAGASPIAAGLKYRSQVTGQVTGHRSQVTGQVTGHNEKYL